MRKRFAFVAGNDGDLRFPPRFSLVGDIDHEMIERIHLDGHA